jgi:hypothetical protein
MATKFETNQPCRGAGPRQKGTGIEVLDERLNTFQYHTFATMPVAGQLIVVQIERTARGAWINSLRIMGNAPAAPISSRRERITGLSAWRSAATFAGGYAQSREDVKSSNILKVAESWLQWFEQGGDRPE